MIAVARMKQDATVLVWDSEKDPWNQRRDTEQVGSIITIIDSFFWKTNAWSYHAYVFIDTKGIVKTMNFLSDREEREFEQFVEQIS